MFQRNLLTIKNGKQNIYLESVLLNTEKTNIILIERTFYALFFALKLVQYHENVYTVQIYSGNKVMR